MMPQGEKVSTKSTEEFLAEIQLPIDDPRLFSRVYNGVAKERKIAQSRDGDNLRRVCAEEFEDLSLRLDATGIQESCSVRNTLRARRLANLLINDKGEVISSLLPRVINLLTLHLYSLGPDRQHDSKRQEQIIKVLSSLRDNKEAVQLLKRISRPFSHPLADQIIRDTLQLPHSTVISDAHARRAALAAWMSYLRQNIGSCFATAPAIIVHDEQPELFLIDLHELLSTGSLKRIVRGVEYSVPLSTTWGSGDLRKSLILTQKTAKDMGEIWYAPGLHIALEAIDILPKDATTQDQVVKTKQLVLDAFPEWKHSHSFLLTTIEEILRRILLNKLGLTQDDLDAYNERPKDMIHTSLLMQVSAAGSGMQGKGKLCATFYSQLEVASSAFKGIADNAMLKAWEFTLASFSETKSDFTRWNLYASLGLNPENPGGIGSALYQQIKHKLDQCNQKLADMQLDYENMFAVVKQLEMRMRHAGSDKDGQWAHAEYQSRVNEFRLMEEMRNREHVKSGLYVRLFDMLIDAYDQLFPVYFQEVFDADLHEVQVGPFDDSPAGFRLLYKHGRSNTSQWTKITNPQEFVDALARFFMTTEAEIASKQAFEDIQSDIADIVTTIVNHVRSTEFLESAFHRMAAAHHTASVANPIENWEKLPAKPWAYISGGTAKTLLTCYYSREQPPTEVARWVENPMELLVFLVDTLKHSPYSMMEDYVRNPDKSMIMHSPTHVFLLKPGISPFKEAWRNEAFTHTWVRDQLVQPMEDFNNSLELNEEMLKFLVLKFSEIIPSNFQFYFKKVFTHMFGPMNSRDLRYHLLDRIKHEKGLQYDGQGVLSSDEIDRTLYSLLPLFPAHELSERLTAIWQSLPGMTNDFMEQLNRTLEECQKPQHSIISAQGLQEICLSILCLTLGKTSLHYNLQQQVALQAQKLGYCSPRPIFFADTNWAKDYFAFVISPGTGNLELWRVDILGKTGTPMSAWKHWVDGTKKEPQWGVYTRPQEYTAAHKNAPFGRRI